MERPVYLCAAAGVPALGPSGASAHVRGVATALGATIVTPRLADRRGVHAQIGVPVIACGVSGWPSWLSAWEEEREIYTARRCTHPALGLRPTLLWERYSLFSDAGWKVARNSKARWILEVNAPLVQERARFESLPQRKLAEHWERRILSAAGAEGEVVAVSRWLVDWLGSMGVKSRLLSNGVSRHAGDRESARRDLGFTDDDFVIGFLGSMKPWHGVEALPGVVERIPGAVGLCVGEGPVKLEHARVRTVGQVNEARAADLVAAMDVGLAPYGAGAPPWFCPLKILAYRAQGTPVIATDTGDCSLVTGDGGTVVSRVEDLADAAASWRGRRCTPHVRGWDTVVEEALSR